MSVILVEMHHEQVELHMGVMLNDVSVMVLTHLEEEVTRTKASSKKTAKRGQWLGIRSPFDDDVSRTGPFLI